MFSKLVAFEMYLPKKLLLFLAALIFLTCCVKRVEAFDAADYQGLADATSSATIPPGTTITAGVYQRAHDVSGRCEEA